MAAWKDITSYRQNDTARIPATFELRLSGFRIIVTRHIHHEPDVWIVSCPPFADGLEISKGTAEEAQNSAMAFILAKLGVATKELLATVRRMAAI